MLFRDRPTHCSFVRFIYKKAVFRCGVEVCLFSHCSKEYKQRHYLHSHLIWPGKAAAEVLAGKDSSGPNGVEVFASKASEVGQ